MKLLVKLIFLTLVLISYFFSASIVYLIYFSNRKKFILMINKVVSFYCKLGVMVLDLDIESNIKEVDLSENYLLVGNHQSYLDIFALSSLVNTNYVTSVEVKNTAFLGPVTILAGCLFVERRSRSQLFKEIEDVTKSLESGGNVTIFPEATSTNGEKMRAFKRSLFQAGIDSKKAVLPFSLNYIGVNGEKISRSNRDLVCWYDDMDFGPHLFNLLKSEKVKIEIIFHESIKTKNQDNKELRDATFDKVASGFKPILA